MIDFEWFRDEYCCHQAGIMKFGKDEDEPIVLACDYKHETRAKSWDDWQPCNIKNCQFMKKVGESDAG